MLLVNWGQSLSVDQVIFKGRPFRTPSIWLLGLFLTFGFFSAGFGKALAWIDFDFGANGFLGWLYVGYYSLGRQELLAPLAIKVRPLWIWEFADISAVCFELGFMFAFIRRRWFMTWLVVACIFHFTNCLILNIPFSSYSICYLAFVPWSIVIPKLKTIDHLPVWALVGMFLLITSILAGSQLGVFRFVVDGSWQFERAALVWVGAGVVILLAIYRERATIAPHE